MTPNRRFASLSDDLTIEYILEDIPFFCVGIMTFGVSTLLIVTKRGSFLGILLFLSALLAFAASIFDLIQLLARGSTKVTNGTGITSATQGLINTRNVLLSLSLGARFIFYWIFVAQRPRNQPRSIPRPSSYNPRYDAHSNSWQRWGYLGFVLKWSLLSLSVAIPILQIIWRIAQPRFGPVYQVDSTMEIVVSSLFILKILLNIYLTSSLLRWRTLLSYLAPLLALSISLGLSIAELFSFDLIDTILGRFLQAIELYTLIVYLVILVFLPGLPPPRPPRSPTLPMQFSQSEKGFYMSNPITVISPRSPVPASRSPDITAVDRNNHVLNIGNSFPSSSIRPPSLYRPKARTPSLVTPILSQTDVDKRASLKTTLSANNAAERDEEEHSTNDAIAAANAKNDEQSDVGVDIRAESTDENPRSSSLIDPSGRVVTMSFSYYTQSRTSTGSASSPVFPPLPRLGSDSPIYGLNGIIVGDSARPNSQLSAQSVATAGSSETSFEELLRQQSELDKSIAALRLFSPAPATSTFSQPPESVVSALPAHVSMTASSSSGLRAESSPSRSEFSLSVFPEPPMVSVNKTSPLLSPEARTAPPSSRLIPTDVSERRTDSFDLNSSVPNSPTRPGLGHERYDSAGTQYDVTSFIGDLTVPSVTSGPRPGSMLKGAPELSDVESGDESPVIVTAASASTRSIIVGSATPSLTTFPSTSVREAQVNEMGQNSNTLRPFFLGNVTSSSSPAVSSPLSAAPITAVSSYTTRNPPMTSLRRPPGRVGLSGTYRRILKVSGPNQLEGLDTPGAYERPRPPPLVIPGDSQS